MDAQQQIYSLMALAEEQQKAVTAALDGLAAERAAFAKERAAVAQAAASVAGVAGEVRKAASDSIPAIQKAAGSAVDGAVRASLAGASEIAANALSEASRPVIGQLSGVARAAGEAEGKLNGAVAAFGWRWAMLAGGAAVGGVAAVLMAAWLVVWWQRDQVEDLQAQRQELAADIEQMQADVAALEKRGGRIKMSNCAGRLCIEASSNQGKNQDGSAAELGSWSRDDGKGGRVKLVIPRGY